MALTALGILAGVGGGLALAALAGARRSDSAFDRLREVTDASDAVVFISQAGIADPDWTPLIGSTDIESMGSKALYERQPGLARIENLNVKLRPGVGVADFATHASRALAVPDVPVLDLRLAGKRVTNATHFERDALALFALVVAVATLVLVGQAISRSVRSGADELPILATLGLTRAQRAATLTFPHLLVVATAVVVAVVVALGLSPLFPIGFSRGLDPDVGLHADWLVIASGAIAASLVLFGFTAFVAARAAIVEPNPATARPSRLTQKVRELGAPLPVSVGMSLALESGRGQRALCRPGPALVAVVAAVAGIVAATTFATGITDALQHPERFGSGWDLEITPDSNPEITLDTAHELLKQTDPSDIEGAAVVRKQQLTVEGHTQPTYSITPVSGSLRSRSWRAGLP